MKFNYLICLFNFLDNYFYAIGLNSSVRLTVGHKIGYHIHRIYLHIQLRLKSRNLLLLPRLNNVLINHSILH